MALRAVVSIAMLLVAVSTAAATAAPPHGVASIATDLLVAVSTEMAHHAAVVTVVALTVVIVVALTVGIVGVTVGRPVRATTTVGTATHAAGLGTRRRLGGMTVALRHEAGLTGTGRRAVASIGMDPVVVARATGHRAAGLIVTGPRVAASAATAVRVTGRRGATLAAATTATDQGRAAVPTVAAGVADEVRSGKRQWPRVPPRRKCAVTVRGG
mmetsp:Transcript_40723/g.81654  ORF Transcript_40723/g.81654 Transcript_40723/m.81654 type:complete len:214 (-) Transcript_40723:28-669(-)